MRETANPRSLVDDDLLRGLAEVLKRSRRVEADLVAFIAEVDARRLYAREASPSMHAYCIEILHLSEPETALRIHVARASRQHPMLLGMFRDGRLHLSGIALLAPHLTAGNRQALQKRATHKSKRQIEEIVAELRPREDVPAGMRKLPGPRAQGVKGAVLDLRSGPAAGAGHRPDDVGASNSLRNNALERDHRLDDVPRRPLAARRPARVEPLAPARFQVRFTASQALHDKLERLQALMRSSVPDGDLGALIEAAVTEKLARLEAKRFGKTKAARKGLAETDTAPTSRSIPAAVRRIVYERDEGRCTYVDARGRRCTARDRLEFHHHGVPFGRGGDHSPDNVFLTCRTHNALMAELEYGKDKMARYRRRPSRGRVSERIASYGAGTTAGSPKPTMWERWFTSLDTIPGGTSRPGPVSLDTPTQPESGIPRSASTTTEPDTTTPESGGSSRRIQWRRSQAPVRLS